MQPRPRDWNPLLGRLLVVLAVLLVILAFFGVLYVIFAILHRFGQVIFLFGLGAILAYILTPLVNALQFVFRARWIAILGVYLALVAALALLAALLFTPFLQQSQALRDNLQNPAPTSLQAIGAIQTQVDAIQTDIRQQRDAVDLGGKPPVSSVQDTNSRLAALQGSVRDLAAGHTPSPPPAKAGEKAVPQTQVPPRYVRPLTASVDRLASDYQQAVQGPTNVQPNPMDRPLADVKQVSASAQSLRGLMSSTPIMILKAQSWLDARGIDVNLQDNVGKAIKDLSDQSASLLNNAVGILSKAANVVLNTVLVLIISIYFLSDGGRLVRWSVDILPERYRDEAAFFVHSTDRVLGGYLRGQLVVALLAGVLAGGGAMALGVPYPVLIGIITFLLELVPVIGPVVLIVPPVVISLIFMPISTTAILLVYFVVFQQIVTNIIGPRIIGSAVGIHPLEAMAAALIGYPVAGFLGSFMAVPAVGILHIIVRAAYHEFVLAESRQAVASTGTAAQPQAQPPVTSTPVPTREGT